MNAQQTVALTAAGGLGLIVAFQVALVLGAPFGAAAWGGTTSGPLPANLRIASAIAGVVWASAAVIVLSRAGLDVVSLPAGLTWWGTWILVGILSVGVVLNAASASPWVEWTSTEKGLAMLVWPGGLARAPAGDDDR